MQFIPTTWKSVGRDGNGDGTANPHNLFDTATTTAAYLSAGGKDLADPEQLRQAIYSYNHSMAYVATEPNGYPAGSRATVDRTPRLVPATSVRARSA